MSREADQNGNPPITAGSPAEAAGIQAGRHHHRDRQTKIDTEHPLDAVLAQNAPGDTIQLSILRGGQPSTVDVTLAVRAQQPVTLGSGAPRPLPAPGSAVRAAAPDLDLAWSSGPPSWTSGLRTRTPTSATGKSARTSWAIASASASSSRNEVDSTIWRVTS